MATANSSAAPSNMARVHEYLRAIESMGPPEAIEQFFTPDVVIREFPNRIVPHGRVGRATDVPAVYERGRKLLERQSYAVQRAIESVDTVAVEVEWTGVLAISAMDLPAGTEMKALVAMFFTFRDDKIPEQHNYDCYPPFEVKRT